MERALKTDLVTVLTVYQTDFTLPCGKSMRYGVVSKKFFEIFHSQPFHTLIMMTNQPRIVLALSY